MMLECSAKTAIGVKELFDNAVRVALCARGYRRKSRMNSACQWCGKHSKATCKCERMKAKVLLKLNLRTWTAREWCRIFSRPERHLAQSEGVAKLLLDFFATRPGLRKTVGGTIARYYDPFTAEPYDKKSSC